MKDGNLAILLAVLAGLCWGVGELCTKYVLHGKQIGPITAITLRSTIAIPILWITYFVTVHVLKYETPNWGALTGRQIWAFVLGSGFLAGSAAMIFFYSSMKLAPISVVKPIAFTLAPAVAVILGWLVLHEAMTLRKGLAVGLIVLGVILLTGNASAPAHAPAPAEGATAPAAPAETGPAAH